MPVKLLAIPDAAQKYQWARRALGGRWTYDFDPILRYPPWSRVEECPAAHRAADEHDGVQRLFYGCCVPGDCRCEVWP